jgi:hypothetical protein
LAQEVAGVRLPDSKLAREANAWVRDVSKPLVYHHVLRSYVFAELLGQARGLTYDSEVLYLGAVMHDLGLTERYAGAERFEVDGANAARDFLVQRQVPREVVSRVWDAVALHTSAGIAGHKEPEVALAHFGISMDVIGLGAEHIGPERLAAVVAAFPRLGFKKGLTTELCGVLHKKPHTAFGNFLSEVGHRHLPGFRSAHFCDLLEAAPFSE